MDGENAKMNNGIHERGTRVASVNREKEKKQVRWCPPLFSLHTWWTWARNPIDASRRRNRPRDGGWHRGGLRYRTS